MIDCTGEFIFKPGNYTLDIRAFFPENGRVLYKVTDDLTGEIVVDRQ